MCIDAVAPAAITIFVCSSNWWMAGNFVEARKKRACMLILLSCNDIFTTKCEMQNAKCRTESWTFQLAINALILSPHKSNAHWAASFQLHRRQFKGNVHRWAHKVLAKCKWYFLLFMALVGIRNMVDISWCARSGCSLHTLMPMLNAMHTLSCNIDRTNR